MVKRRCITRKLGNSKDDLLIKEILDSYKKIDMERPDSFDCEWDLDDVITLKDYVVTLFISNVKPILAIDVSSRYSHLTTSFFDLTEICKMKFDKIGDLATVISLGYLVDRVLDEYEQGLSE